LKIDADSLAGKEQMPIIISQVSPEDVAVLWPLLLLAEPSESALRWSLANLSDTAYRMDDGGEVVGAATVRWHKDPCEIIELAVTPERQGGGFGKQFIAWLLDEARRRGKSELLVGTSNASLGNIIFYQKCGFRMSGVRDPEKRAFNQSERLRLRQSGARCARHAAHAVSHRLTGQAVYRRRNRAARGRRQSGPRRPPDAILRPRPRRVAGRDYQTLADAYRGP
jgi:GNAT superfamily N-acetyltransferase